MATVEIDEAELRQYQQLYQVAKTMNQNPKAKKFLLQAQKTAFPDAVIPELEADEQQQAAISGVLDEVKSLKAQLADDRAEREQRAEVAKLTQGWEQQRQALRQAGYTDEGIVAIEDHAQKEGIPNLRAAAHDYTALHPPQQPVQPSGFGSWEFFNDKPAEDDTFMKDMMASKGDNDGALNREIAATLSDFRGQSQSKR